MTHEQFLYLEKLRKALEWFADEDNYRCTEHGNCDGLTDPKNIPVNVLGLDIAKKALETNNGLL